MTNQFITAHCSICGYIINVQLYHDNSYSDNLYYFPYDDGKVQTEYWECACCNPDSEFYEEKDDD